MRNPTKKKWGTSIHRGTRHRCTAHAHPNVRLPALRLMRGSFLAALSKPARAPAAPGVFALLPPSDGKADPVLTSMQVRYGGIQFKSPAGNRLVLPTRALILVSLLFQTEDRVGFSKGAARRDKPKTDVSLARSLFLRRRSLIGYRAVTSLRH